MRLRTLSCLAVALCFLFFSKLSPAQDLPEFEIGLKPFGTYHGGSIDSVSITNGNLTIDAPLFPYPQRGPRLKKSVDLFYNNKGYRMVTHCNRITGDCTTSTTWRGGGIGIGDPEDVTGIGMSCAFAQGGRTAGLPVVWTELGNSHVIWPTTLGYRMSFDSTGIRDDTTTGIITHRDGTRYLAASGSAVDREDANGNEINIDGTDTLGRLISRNGVASDTVGCPAGQRTVTGAYIISVPGPGGTSSQIKYCVATVPFSTNFGFVDYQYVANVGLIQSVLLYNGSSWNTSQAWTFEYSSSDPGDPAGTNYGDLTKIIFPTGGTISYHWGMMINFTQESRVLLSRTVNANDGTGPHTWSYTPVGVGGGTNTVTDPLGNDTVHTVTYVGNGQSGYVTKTQYYQGSHTTGTLLKTETTDYTYTAVSSLNCTGIPYSPAVFQVQPIRVTTTWPNGNVSKVETDYDTNSFTFVDSIYNVTYPGSYGQVLAVRHYDYGSGAPGALLSQTVNTYIAPANSTYNAYNFLDLLLSVSVKDGSGVQKAYTTYGYDETPLQPSGVTTQHDSSPPNGATRGNLTSTHKWININGTYLVSTNTYFDTGTVDVTTDPRGNQTTYAYSSTFAGAYPTTVTNALSQSTANNYDFNTGLLASATDPNNLTTSYTYDTLFRTTQVTHPDAGQTSFTYQDSSIPFSVTVTKSINSGQNLQARVVVDGVGRKTQTQLLSDPQGTVYTDTSYDAVGRVRTTSNPYRSGTDLTSNPGTTTYSYDALGRKTSETYPDSSVLTTAYCGPSTLVTDPTGRWRRSTTDALGRLIEVDEPNAPRATVNPNGCPGTGEPIWVTSYSYDALGNLTQVLQNGSRQRNFSYDSLSRLLTAANPESGTTTYAYDSNSACPTPNSFPSLLVSKTDARGIRTCAQYDALNRITQKNYSNGDPATAIVYDQPNCLGLSACSNIGQRTSMTDAAGSEAWAFQVDAVNRRSVHVDQRTTASSPNNITRTATYYLDLAGNVTRAAYPTGRVVNYTYDSANRPSTAADASNGITYATGFQSSPGGTCLNNVTCYTPQGTFYALSIGQTSTFTGLNLTHMYNSRLQPLEFKASSTGGNAIDITYSFLDPANNKNAGHVFSITNNLDGTRSQTFGYDQLNRITAAQTTSTYATSPGHCWGETYGVDAWSNLQSIAQTTNPQYTGCLQESGFSRPADGNNHLSGFSYDLSGNTTSDTVYSYNWNAESQLKSAGGVNYLYDGDGRRVAKVGSKLYWYGAGSEIVAETDAAGNTVNEYVFFGGQRIAMLPVAGNPLYYVEDMLGTSRVVTTNTGVVCYEADFYPYGGERSYTNTCPQNNYKFEGKERDTETGNDDFGARYYSNRFGRWLSADWSAVPAPVPYANFTNPQTLNLYAMVSDDPESFADLDGHYAPPVQDALMPGPQDYNGWSVSGYVTDSEPDTVLERQQQQQAQNPPASGEGSQTNLARREAIANSAEDALTRSRLTQVDPYGPNECSRLVSDSINKAGAKAEFKPDDGPARPPVAGEWASSRANIPGWRVLGPNEKPAPGDVAAYSLHSSTPGRTGDSAIVTRAGRGLTTVHAGDHGVLHDQHFIVGNPSGSWYRAVVYRRYTGE